MKLNIAAYNRFITKVAEITVLILLFSLIPSCDEINTDPPVITRVRSIEPATAGVDMEGAGLNEWVVIQGRNLATTQHIYFNDFEAGFNPVYVTETDIVVQIPAETPNIGTNPDASNILKVVTEHGEATVEFITFAPPAVISAMSCEYTLPGDTMLLLGQYFFGVDSVLFPGDYAAEILSTSDDGLFCRVIVPEEATESGRIRVVTKGGMSETGMFRDITGLICNYDDVNRSENWGGYMYNSDLAILVPELTGNVWISEASNMVGPSYWNQTMVNAIVSGEYPDYSGVSAENLYLKFEMFVTGPWNAGYFEVTLVFKETGTDLNDNGELYDWLETYKYFLKPWDQLDGVVDIETTNWITVSIPLSAFSKSGDNTNYLASFDLVGKYNFMGLYFVNPSTTTIPHLLIATDNFRMIDIRGWMGN